MSTWATSLRDTFDIDEDWLGRLVRVLVVFRAFVLVVTIIVLPPREHTSIVGVAVFLAIGISWVPLRHWTRIGRSVARHPAYLALEVLLATLILAAAGARSPFFYFTLGTAAIAGVVYGRRGALPFSALLIAAYELVALEGFPSAHPLHDAQSVAFVPLLYPVALAAGLAARNLIQRGAETEALLRERTEALAGERERSRVARELHDSLAKTVEGLAMAASVLPAYCRRDPTAAAALAGQLADDARQAALEARALMAGLRPTAASALSLGDAVRSRAEGFARRAGVAVDVRCSDGDEELPIQTKHELLRILGEALVNAQRHGQAASVTVSLEHHDGDVILSVADDGRGLPGPVDVEQLKAEGHFGLAGMYERALAIGGVLSVGARPRGGTIVTARLPSTEERGASGENAEARQTADGASIPFASGLRPRRLRHAGPESVKA